MKIGPLILIPLGIWALTDLIVPQALAVELQSPEVNYADYLGPIIGTIAQIIGDTLGLKPDTFAQIALWTPFILGILMGLSIPLFVFLGIRFSGRILSSGVDISLADETLHMIYLFLLFLGLYLIFGAPAYIYLQLAKFPLTSIFFAITSLIYTVGVFGLISRGN